MNSAAKINSLVTTSARFSRHHSRMENLPGSIQQNRLAPAAINSQQKTRLPAELSKNP